MAAPTIMVSSVETDAEWAVMLAGVETPIVQWSVMVDGAELVIWPEADPDQFGLGPYGTGEYGR